MKLLLILFAILILGCARHDSIETEIDDLVGAVKSGLLNNHGGEIIIKTRFSGLLVLTSPYAVEGKRSWDKFHALVNDAGLLDKFKTYVRASGNTEKYALIIYDNQLGVFSSRTLEGFGFEGDFQIFKVNRGDAVFYFHKDVLHNVVYSKP